jgi:hypothetical protein
VTSSRSMNTPTPTEINVHHFRSMPMPPSIRSVRRSMATLSSSL